MNYAIKILEDEKSSLEMALNKWESKEYPNAKKEREKRLKDINEALYIITVMKSPI